MDTHKVPISKRTYINYISQTIRFVLTYNYIKQSNLLPYWKSSSFCSTATSYFQSLTSILSLENFIKCIHNETHVHVHYLIIILLQITCTSVMCEPHWGHPDYIKSFPISMLDIFIRHLKWWQIESHVKATYPVPPIIFLVYYFCGCTWNREYSQKKCAILKQTLQKCILKIVLLHGLQFTQKSLTLCNFMHANNRNMVFPVSKFTNPLNSIIVTLHMQFHSNWTTNMESTERHSLNTCK